MANTPEQKAKQDVAKGSTFLSGGSGVKKQKPKTSDPFVDMVENGSVQEVIKFVAENPNVSKQAIQKIIEVYPLESSENWELRDKLASNLNLPQDPEIRTALENSYGNDEPRNFYEVREEALARYSDVRVYGNYGSENEENITVSTHEHETELLLGDPNTPENTKKNIREKRAKGRRELDKKKTELRKIKEEHNKIDDEMVREHEQNRKSLLSKAKKGEFDSKSIQKAREEMKGGNAEANLVKEIHGQYTQEQYEERKKYEKIIEQSNKDRLSVDPREVEEAKRKLADPNSFVNDKSQKDKELEKHGITSEYSRNYIKKSDKQEIEDFKNRQELLALKEKHDIQMARKGQFDAESLQQAREMVGTSYRVKDGKYYDGTEGDLKDPKQLNYQQKQSRYASLDLIKLKREDEIKRAKRGDFSDMSLTGIPEGEKYTEVKGDAQHRKRLMELKREDEIKRAKRGDFSTVTIPDNLESLPKEEQRHFKEIQSLKKEDQLKRAKKGDFTGIVIPEDTSGLSKQDKRHFEELSRLKKANDEREAKRKEKEERDRKREEKDRKDNPGKYAEGPEGKKSATTPEEIIAESLEGNRKELQNLSREGAAAQQNMLVSAARGSVDSARKDIRKIATGSSRLSASGLAQMKEMKQSIGKGTAKVGDDGSQQTEITAESTMTARVSKMQPNTHKLNLAEDRITEIARESKRTPEFKTLFG